MSTWELAAAVILPLVIALPIVWLAFSRSRVEYRDPPPTSFPLAFEPRLSAASPVARNARTADVVSPTTLTSIVDDAIYAALLTGSTGQVA